MDCTDRIVTQAVTDGEKPKVVSVRVILGKQASIYAQTTG